MGFINLEWKILFQFKVNNKQVAFHLIKWNLILKNSLHEMGVNET